MQEKVDDSINEIEQLKQYGRRKAVRINDPSCVELPSESTDDIVESFIKDTLEIEDVDKDNICRSHRVGDSTKSTGPRSILVKFTSYRAKEKVMKARKKLAGTRITVNDDLTKATGRLQPVINWLSISYDFS